MYVVKIYNGESVATIHDEYEKLRSGSVVKGINTIDSFSFEILPSNIGFNAIRDFQTLVTVYNTNKDRYEFYGRVLYSTVSMEESGLIKKEVTCESYLGYLCDSQQVYVPTKNWTVRGLLEHIINVHNSLVEEYKKFEIGEVTVTDPNDNLYLGIQRENSWKTINDKLIGKLGGEIRFRVVDDVIYLDYLTQIGEQKDTEIALSRNMKSIMKEDDPTSYITRLIPLGCKLSDNTEERLDISNVNNGCNYIDDETAIAVYGIHVGYVEFDDVTSETALLEKGKQWQKEVNKIKIKYSISALDLSLIGLALDDLDTHNYYPVKNPLIGVDDVARIVKKNINICEEISSTIEIGDNFKTLSDVYQEQTEQMKQLGEEIKIIQSTATEFYNNLLVKVVESTEADLYPGEYRVFGVVDGLEINLIPIDDGNANEYLFEFIPSEAFLKFIIKPDVSWVSPPDIRAGKVHQVSILRGIGVMISA